MVNYIEYGLNSNCNGSKILIPSVEAATLLCCLWKAESFSGTPKFHFQRREQQTVVPGTLEYGNETTDGIDNHLEKAILLLLLPASSSPINGIRTIPFPSLSFCVVLQSTIQQQ
jgi:hypothetical protein